MTLLAFLFFAARQVDWLAEHLHSKGERVLIIMPWYHCAQDNFVQ